MTMCALLALPLMSDDDIVSEVNKKNYAKDEGLEDGVEEEHEISTFSILDMKPAVNTLNIFFFFNRECGSKGVGLFADCQ